MLGRDNGDSVGVGVGDRKDVDTIVGLEGTVYLAAILSGLHL